MVLDYLRHNGNYIPTNLDSETKILFNLEINYWGIGIDKIIESRLPKELV